MHRTRSVALVPVVLMLTVLGCTGTPGAPASSPATVPSAPASPAPSAESPSGGAVGGNPGVTPAPVVPGAPGASGGPVPVPSAVAVQPISGLHDVHDVRATALTASAVIGRLSATVSWWSGPPPCSALAEVAVTRNGSSFALAVREGAQQLGVACPAMAMYKSTTVDLGSVAAGTYTVTVLGVDAPMTVTVTG